MFYFGRMKHPQLTVDILFLKHAETAFRFPVVNSIRMSFWFLEGEGSTFSEISFTDASVEIGKVYRAQINVGDLNIFGDKVKMGAEFKVGTYPYPIAIGRIVDIHAS